MLKVDADFKEWWKLRRLLIQSTLYKGIVVKAWKQTVEEAFASDAFGTWAPLGEFTVRARAERLGYYTQQTTSGVKARRPVNVWTGRLRDAVSGKTASGFSAVNVTRVNLAVNVNTPYMVAALKLRPIDDGPTMRTIELILQTRVRAAMDEALRKKGYY